MAAKHTIAVSVLADTKKFQSSMRNLAQETGLSKVGSNMRRAGAGIAKGLAVATAAGVATGIKFGGLAATLEQSTGAVESVFKSNAKTIAQWAKGADKNLGLTENSYKELAAVLGSQLKNMGLSTDQVVGKTGDLIKLGADLAATFGGPTSDAVAAVSALMRGEADPIERYGVSIKQADINARLAAKGLKGLTGEAAKQAQALTVLELLSEQTKDAQGQFAREAATAAGATERLKASLINKATALGTYLLPAYTAVVQWLGERVEPAFAALQGFIDTKVVPGVQALTAWVQANQAEIALWAGRIQEFLATSLTVLVNALTQMSLALQSAGQWIVANQGWLLSLAAGIATAVAAYQSYIKVMAIWKAAKLAAAAAQTALNVAMTANPIGIIVVAIGALVAALTYFFTQTETGRKTWTKVWAAIQSQFNTAMRTIKPLLRDLQRTWDVLWSAIKKAWQVIGPPLFSVISSYVKAMYQVWSGIFKALATIVKTTFSIISNNIRTVLGVIRGIIKTVTSAMRGDWKGAWQGIKDIAKSIGTGVVNNIKSIGKGMYNAGKDVVRGLVNGIKSMAQAPVNAIKSIGGSVSGAIKSTLGIRSPSRVFKGFGANIVQGLVNGLDENRDKAAASITKIANRIKDAKYLQGKSGLVDYVKREGKDLDRLWKAHDKAVAKLTAARTKLNTLREARASMSAQIADSLRGSINLGSIVAKDSDGNIRRGKTTIGDVNTYVKGLATKARNFAGRLNRLVKAGWPQSLVQHIAGLGWDEGNEVALALLSQRNSSTKSSVMLKSSWASLEQSMKATGSVVSGQMYNVGIAAQQGLVKGLESNAKKTEKAARNLARSLAKWVKKELGIRSPSRIMRTLGAFTTEGLALGITDQAGKVSKSMSRITGLVTDGYTPDLTTEMQVRRRNSTTATGATYNITVNALNASEEVGRLVVQAIKRYELAGGRI